MALLGVLISTIACEARLLPVTPEFVQTKDTELVHNGAPFLFNGFNSYWMMNVAADPNQRYKVSNVFRGASAIGLTVCRTRAFSDGGNQSLQISPGLYNEAMFLV
ncbi:Mannan endo-1,4-beta-mannosidase 1 [Spatholobus suberectus]|nr:Mannan endo-1,4-beta-mannosidase 1 [Spatholobus suberectus]